MRNIKRIRILREYTQIKVQLDTGISQSTLSKYECGEAMPTLENLMILADYYHTSLDYLADRTDHEKPYPPKVE